MMSIRMIPKGMIVADVGCDHARVAIWLVKNNIAPKVIATDLRPGPLSYADANIEYFHCRDQIETRLSDGLANLRPSEAEVILIAGMGGGLMVHILSEGLDRVRAASELILQPQSERGAVRRFLLSNGFAITEEKTCFEDGKFYNSIHAVNVSLCNHESALPEPPYTDCEYEYGRYLLLNRDKRLKDYLVNEYQKAIRVKESLLRNNTENARERLPGFLREISILEEALKIYEHTLWKRQVR